jgi:hypothetical protein
LAGAIGGSLAVHCKIACAVAVDTALAATEIRGEITFAVNLKKTI